MPRYDVFLEGRTENSTCYFSVAVMADDQKEAEYLGHEAGRVKHQECDEIEVVGIRRKDDCNAKISQSDFDSWVWNFCPVCGFKMEDETEEQHETD